MKVSTPRPLGGTWGFLLKIVKAEGPERKCITLMSTNNIENNRKKNTKLQLMIKPANWNPWEHKEWKVFSLHESLLHTTNAFLPIYIQKSLIVNTWQKDAASNILTNHRTLYELFHASAFSPQATKQIHMQHHYFRATTGSQTHLPVIFIQNLVQVA